MTDCERLEYRLKNDLKRIAMPVNEVDIDIKEYSKTFWGRYFPSSVNPKMVLYVYQQKNCREMYPYSVLLVNAIHEMVHHIQYSDPCYIRKKGIMHDSQFWKLFNHYVGRAYILGIIDKEVAEQYGVFSKEFA